MTDKTPPPAPRPIPTLLVGVSQSLYSAYITRLPQDLRTLHNALMLIRRFPADVSAISQARRALHGLKSRSSMVQILPLVKVAGEAEELLEIVVHEAGRLPEGAPPSARGIALIDLIIQAEGIFYETQRLLHQATFDDQYVALSELAVAMCRGMRAAIRQDLDGADVRAAQGGEPSSLEDSAHEPTSLQADRVLPVADGEPPCAAAPDPQRETGSGAARSRRHAKQGRQEAAAQGDRSGEAPGAVQPPAPEPVAVAPQPQDGPVLQPQAAGGERIDDAVIASVSRGPAVLNARRDAIPPDYAPASSPPPEDAIGPGMIPALHAPLARLTALEAISASQISLLGQADALAAQQRRNIERLDATVVRLLLEHEGLRRRHRALREAQTRTGAWAHGADAAPREIAWVDDPMDQTIVQLQEIVADGRELSADLRATLDSAQSGARRAAVNSGGARADLLALRMVSLQEQHERLDQIAMATASRLGRQVRFLMDAGIALDREIAGVLEVPLQHLVRNGVFHGVESPAERRRAGKNPLATVTLRAWAGSSDAHIEVHDDGRGIDVERVTAIAVGKGLIGAAQAAAMTHDERLELILIPGLTTAERATDLAGRGVGLDAVLAAVRSVRGRIELRSEPGRGTTVSLRVPRTLANTLVVVVRQNGHELAIPAEQILDCRELGPGDLAAAEPDAGAGPATRVMVLERRRVPVLSAGLLEPAPQDESSPALALLELCTPRGPIGVLVSEVVEVASLPLTPVPPMLQGLDALLGFLPSANGRARPLVDAARIASQTSQPVRQHAGHAQAQAQPGSQQRSASVLVVDDSASVRRHLRDVFGGAGYAVREAPDGVSALQDIALRGQPDLITLDLEMPGMDGLETLNALRQAHGAAIPIFLITSRAQLQHREAVRALGAIRTFSKPFNAEELLGAAAMALAGARRAQPHAPAGRGRQSSRKGETRTGAARRKARTR